jgi:nucleotide-binding universal stress UspA family protein
MIPIKTILHATDQSECSKAAFRVANVLAQDLGARLVILEVVPSPVVIYGPPTESYLEQLRKELDQMQVQGSEIEVERRLVEGNPATEILRTAEETRCDMIIMGSHGRTGLSRLLLGSVAEQVMRRATCPVLIMRGTSGQSALAENAAVPVGTSLEAGKRGRSAPNVVGDAANEAGHFHEPPFRPVVICQAGR